MKLTSFKALKLAVVVICMLAAGICYSCSMKNHDMGPDHTAMVLEPDEGETGAGETGNGNREAGNGETEAGNGEEPDGSEDTGSGREANHDNTGITAAAQTAQEQAALIYIHVCGLVSSPGVYGLPPKSRVYEAIEAAGGFTEEAAPDCLNLAQVLEDGMKIEVPDRAQAEQWKAQGLIPSDNPAGITGGIKSGAGENSLKAKVNLNRASMEELMTLKGIGQSRAEDIIRYRDNFGGFKSIEDIMNVSGIKDAAFEKIKDSITV